MAIGLSFSVMGRAKACPASLALPSAPDRDGGGDASHGTLFHSFLENLVNAAKALIEKGSTPSEAVEMAIDEALSAVPAQHRLAFGQVDAAWLEPLLDTDELVAEEGYVYNAQTLSGRIAGRGLKHGEVAYDPETEIPGVMDLRALIRGEVLYLLDYKTGHGYVAKAAKNMQLRTAALAAGRALQAQGVQLREVRVGICRIRKGKEDEAWFDHAEFSVEDLELIELEIHEVLDAQREQRRRLRAIEAGTPDASRLDYATGEHCRYCGSLPWCEPKMRLLQAVCNEPLAVEKKLMECTTDEQMAEAYRRLKATKDVVKRANQIVYAAASNHPIPLGDDRFLGMRMVPKEELDGDIVFSVIEERAAAVPDEKLREDLPMIAVKLKASKKGVEEAAARLAQALGLKRAGAKTNREILAAVKDQGGVIDKSKERVTEYLERAKVAARDEDGEAGEDEDDGPDV